MPDDTTLEELSPRVPRAVFVKQDNGGSASVIPVSSVRLPLGEEEKEEASSSPDLNPCSATYSNLGKWIPREESVKDIRLWIPLQAVRNLCVLNGSIHPRKGSLKQSCNVVSTKPSHFASF